MLFAIQGLGDMDFEAVVFVVALYLFHPVSLVLIFLASFGKIASGARHRWPRVSLPSTRCCCSPSPQ